MTNHVQEIYEIILLVDARNEHVVARNEHVVARNEHVVARNEHVVARNEHEEIGKSEYGVAIISIQFYTRGDFQDFPSLRMCPSLVRERHRSYDVGYSLQTLKRMKSETAKNIVSILESNEEVQKMIREDERRESEHELKNLSYYSLLSKNQEEGTR